MTQATTILTRAASTAYRLTDPPLLGSTRAATWRDLAMAAHLRRPLAGVVVASGDSELRGAPPISLVGDLDEEFFATRRERPIPSTASDYVDAARALLRISSRVVLVDPYFKVRSLKWKRFVGAFGRVARLEGCEHVDILTAARQLPGDPAVPGQCDRALTEFFSDCRELSPGKPRFRVRYFADPEDLEVGPLTTEGLHPRYLISDVGGLRYDRGFEPHGLPTTNDVGVIDSMRHGELVSQFMGDLHEFQVAHDFSWPKDKPGFRMSGRT